MHGARDELDTVFSLLADQRRRHVLYYLTRESGSVDVPELVAAVAERERGEAEADPGDDLRRRIRLSLYHVHLPKLENAGVVRFSGESGRVELDDPGIVTPFLDRAAAGDDVDGPSQQH